MFARIAFALFTLAAVYLFSKKASAIYRNILLGKPFDPGTPLKKRWENVFLLALGQKKMFANPLVATLHLVIYAGFIIINIEILEIILDGLLGTHRLFFPMLGTAYGLLIDFFEILALGVLGVCVVFLVRRNGMGIGRLVHNELEGWPKSDANYILIAEIVLMTLFLSMNAADWALQSKDYGHYSRTGPFAISQFIAPLLSNLDPDTLVLIERSCWWLHILGIYAFLNYLPWSKHLHIVLAFPNAYFAPLGPAGKMTNMPSVTNEVLYMMEPETMPADPPAPERFGAKDIRDLSWKNLLDAYSCTECGRCTAACPANQTGKLLSPRAIMMKTRDRAEVLGQHLEAGKPLEDDTKTLLHDYITPEELRACTTCNACVEACPVSISPLDIIYELRRYLIMEESNAPKEWTPMFSNIENNGAPWQFNPSDRDAWTKA